MLIENVKNNTPQVPGDTTAANRGAQKTLNIAHYPLKNTLNFVKGPSSYPPGGGGVTRDYWYLSQMFQLFLVFGTL